MKIMSRGFQVPAVIIMCKIFFHPRLAPLTPHPSAPESDQTVATLSLVLADLAFRWLLREGGDFSFLEYLENAPSVTFEEKKKKKEKKEKARGQIEPKHLCCGGVLTRFSVAARQTASRSHVSSLFSPKSKGGSGGWLRHTNASLIPFFFFFWWEETSVARSSVSSWEINSN